MTYSNVTVTGYNDSPPSDDGTVSAANQAKWSTVKTKLFDPLQTALEAINTGIDNQIALIEEDFYEAGTTCLFAQTAAPTGWSKSLDTNYYDVALRCITGTTGGVSGGSLAFSSVFAMTPSTLSQANLPNVNWNVSLNVAAHTHGAGTLVEPTHSDAAGWEDIATTGGAITVLRGSGMGENRAVYSPQVSVTGNTAASGTFAVDGTISSGGTNSDINLDFSVKYTDFIVASLNG